MGAGCQAVLPGGEAQSVQGGVGAGGSVQL